ncbi:hypothetical protein [Paracoccus sp. JM45]|uniref:hypothetical protein n=1 Tax=Paracoccus sp. JM45 TaxID=2283626 RepID=UPI000E6D5408|nr:hypothetical protein [Paracoccus sp. JM45]RJE80763.1 hypothetical protein DWB67_03890 [Paracoccus sp. JM45]
MPERIARLCISVLIAIALFQIFHASDLLAFGGGLALVVFFATTWRQLTVVSFVPMALAMILMVEALIQGVGSHVFALALERAIFLASLLALLGVLRTAAAVAPEIERAGKYLTAQPPGRRYLALNFGGHIFGTLINLGGLAILLDMAMRSMATNSAHLPPDLQEVKFRRMTLAVTRGFALVALWSPMGFAVNSLLLSMPELDYLDFAPLGFALSFVCAGYGWVLDRVTAPRGRNVAPPASPPDPADGRAVWLLLTHVGLLGVAVIALNALTILSFQQSLLLVVPSYSLGWAAWTGGRNAIGVTGNVVRQAVSRFPLAASELGVFASAGLLSVLVVEVMPTEAIRILATDLHLTALPVIWIFAVTLFGLACIGINPIITASVMGSLGTQLGIAGLSDVAIAVALIGVWSAVMCFSPFITTVAYAGAVVGRSPFMVGVRWNWVYSTTLALGWTIATSLAVYSGLL